VAPKLCEFVKRWPEVEIRLDLSDRSVDVVGENFDLLISSASVLPPGLVARPLDTVKHIIVATPGYLSKTGMPLEPGELSDHVCVPLGESDCKRQITLRRHGDEHVVPVHCRLATNDCDAVVAAVCAGLGFGLVPDFCGRRGNSRR
jgi:DNA-binding transcriptional LysR family regulator